MMDCSEWNVTNRIVLKGSINNKMMAGIGAEPQHCCREGFARLKRPVGPSPLPPDLPPVAPRLRSHIGDTTQRPLHQLHTDYGMAYAISLILGIAPGCNTPPKQPQVQHSDCLVSAS